MKFAVKFALAFWAGYWVVTKAAPVLQAKIEAVNLDEMWEVFDES